MVATSRNDVANSQVIAPCGESAILVSSAAAGV